MAKKGLSVHEPDIDCEHWSGEGDFTQTLVDWLILQDAIAFVRVEDSTAHNDVGYNFISNEIFLRFRTEDRIEHERVWGLFPRHRTVTEKLMTIEQLESLLVEAPEIESPDYADEAMIQFLHTERVIPPYQTKGYKLIELVRVYEVGTSPKR